MDNAHAVEMIQRFDEFLRDLVEDYRSLLPTVDDDSRPSCVTAIAMVYGIRSQFKKMWQEAEDDV